MFFERLHRSKSAHWKRRVEPLVTASTIEGLPNLTGYIKSRDLVVAAIFPRLDAQPKHSAFLAAPLASSGVPAAAKAMAAGATGSDGIERSRKPRQRDLDRVKPWGFEIFE
jgi:hypothetical protein